MFLGQGHCRVEANDRKLARHVKNSLNYGFANSRDQKIQLRRIVPGHVRAVIAVIDVTRVTGMWCRSA